MPLHESSHYTGVVPFVLYGQSSEAARVQMQLPEWFGEWFKALNIPIRRRVIDDLYGQYRENNPRFAGRLDQFQAWIDFKYKPDSTGHTMLSHGLRWATVAHQFNRVEKRRTRKSDGQPTILHSIEMAEFQLETGIKDWLTIAATLFHDVPEDSDLGEGLAPQPDYQKENPWFRIIREEFNDLGGEKKFGLYGKWHAGDLLAELVHGATEQELPFFTRERGQLWDMPLFKMIDGYMNKGGVRGKDLSVKKVDDKERNEIYKVVYNTQRLFDAALTSPDHWRIFFIKIADIWHNLKTPEWVKPVKHLRGRLAASLADWMGWYQARSEIIKSLSTEINVLSPYKPQADEQNWPLTPYGDDFDYIEEIRRYSSEVLRTLSHELKEVSLKYPATVGWPIVNSDKPYEGGVNGKYLPFPEMVISMTAEHVDAMISIGKGRAHLKHYSFSDYLNYTKNGVRNAYLARYNYYESDAAKSGRLMGRKRVDFLVQQGGDNVFTLRLESNEPHIVDLFKGSKLRLGRIPEARLFNRRVRANNAFWDYHLAALIGFFYEPNFPIQFGEKVFLVIDPKNEPVFVNGGLSADTIFSQLGIEAHTDGKRRWYEVEKAGDVFQVLPGGSFMRRVRLGSSARRLSHRIITVKNEA